MDHKAFLGAVPVELREAMIRTTNREGLWYLAAHMGLILGLGALIGIGVPGWWALIPIQGVLIVFLFTLEHEATHRTPFANLLLNEVVGRVAGFLILLPFEWFRYFHLAHHRWTNIEGKDPELAGGKPEAWSDWVKHVSGLPYWWSELRLMLALVLGKADGDFLPEGARKRIVRDARVMALGYLVLAITPWLWPTLVWVWILPVLLGQPFLRLYLLAEHGDCPNVANMFENTRTTFTNRIVRFLAWNMPYHVEHHVWPQVPFHRLPDLHGMMKADLQVTAEGYVSFTREYLARHR
ncbi:MAG TPA: fatty acid desaturase [Tabrizicola sp.]|nr:fatty acid desaturase [Tabrizicola sp.]